MKLIDQLQIGEKLSYDDFGASVKERKKTPPKKKSIKDTVPFSNITYDFSNINGEAYWEESEWEYVFEIIGENAEQVEEKKRAFKTWVMNVFQEKIHDPYIQDYHIVGTFSDITEDDTEFEKATISVLFTAYPYMVSDDVKIFTFMVGAGVETIASIVNNSSHRITPTIITEVPMNVRKGNATYSISAGETTDDSFKLEKGINTLKISATSAGSITFKFHDEVF